MLKNTYLFKLSGSHDLEYGDLIPIEESDTIPFVIRRVYYIYNVPSASSRGYHSHRNLNQVLICVHGSVRMVLKTPDKTEEVILNDPSQALYIGPMVWREMHDFSLGTVLLVLADHHYDKSDYIRNFDQYISEARKYFAGEADSK